MIKLFLLLALFMFSSESYAADVDELWEVNYSIDGSAMNGGEKLVSSIFSVTFMVGLVLGTVMFFAAIGNLINYAKESSSGGRSRATLSGTMVMLMGASMLFGLNQTIGIMTNTLTGGGGYCFNYESKVDVSNYTGSFKNNDATCFDASTSGVTESLRSRLEASGNTAALEDLNRKVTLLFSAFQAIGLIYFVKSIYLLKVIADGSGGQELTYGKVLIMMIFSSLVIDMPNTIDILIETAKNYSSV
jgi:hypothetical protein